VKTVTKYYKGNLLCQFQTVNTSKVGKSTVFTSQSEIALEPRYRYEGVEEITEAEYLQQTAPGATPFIKQVNKADVEFNFLKPVDPAFPSLVKRVDEIIMVLNKGTGQYDDKEPYVVTRPVNDYIKAEADTPKDIYYNADKVASADQAFQFNSSQYYNANIVASADQSLQFYSSQQTGYYSPFDAVYGKASHGKIKGQAYCKEVQLLDDQQKPLNMTQLNQVAAVQSAQNFATSPIGQLVNLTGYTPPQPLPPNGITLPPPNVGQPQRSGCLSFGMGGSQRNSGCLFPLLLLLLAGFLWWLLGMKGCGNSATPAPIIIHDTIRVEVQKIDTLTIVKTDTVSYVDSTTKLNYETVNLPNVQFITNSDVLLPSSASDLQKLAEYLIKNDSLNATILGHTDNVGKSEDNMKLSQRRAESVKRFLGSLGVDPKRLEAVGKGDTEPKADNNLEEGRLMNRRVEVQLTNTEFVTTKRTKVELVPEEGKNKEKKKNHP
jgi:outer membrane protein OmpA-like peptidoglycan-associated protein